MKKQILTIALLLIAACTPATRVFAADSAVGTAQLAIHQEALNGPDQRVIRLKAFLESYNSPLAQEAETFVAEADKNNLDWRLVAAISGTESTFGKQIPTGSYNAWGWGIPTGAQSGIGFRNWEQGIETVSEGLAKNYYGRGAKTLYDVGWIYAANGNSWGNHTAFFIAKIESFVPSTPETLSVSI